LYPLHIRLGALAISGMSVLLIAGIFAAWVLCQPLLVAAGLGRRTFYSLLCVCVPAGVLGARFMFTLTHRNALALGASANVLTGGSAAMGAIVCIPLAAALYLKLTRRPILPWLDLLTVVWGVMIVFGRLGCFVEGCCYGKPAHGWGGVTFAPGTPAAERFPGVALVPTQIIEAAAGLIMCFVAWRLIRSGARAGLALSWGLVWYGCSRGAVDFLRAYDASSTLGEIHGYAIPISQVCSVLLVLVGAGIGYSLWSRKESRSPPSAGAIQLGRR